MQKLKHQRFILTIALMLSLTMHLIYGIEGAAQLGAMEQKLQRQAAQLKDKQEQIEVLEVILERRDTDDTDELEYIGKFTITHYCACNICCGKSDGITYTGTKAQEGRTVAVDPDVIPLGSTVIIDGQEYVAEDVGGAIKGNRLDIFKSSHDEALQAGILQAEVYIGRREWITYQYLKQYTQNLK